MRSHWLRPSRDARLQDASSIGLSNDDVDFGMYRRRVGPVSPVRPDGTPCYRSTVSFHPLTSAFSYFGVSDINDLLLDLVYANNHPGYFFLALFTPTVHASSFGVTT